MNRLQAQCFHCRAGACSRRPRDGEHVPYEYSTNLNLQERTMKFHGLNYYSKQPQKIFDFYKTLGFRVHQEKESDDYFGAALALTDEQEPIMWIWSIPEGKEQLCCNNLYFTTNGKVYEIYENIRAAGIECPEPFKTFWGGTELILTDPDGNTILFI